MHVDPGPLTLVSAVSAWHLDASSAAVIVALAAGYLWAYRHGRSEEHTSELQSQR